MFYIQYPKKTNIKSYNPVGDTDSEAVFCAILNYLKHEFDSLPTLPVLYDVLKSLCVEICENKHKHPHQHRHNQSLENHEAEAEAEPIFNFLLMCGEHVQFAYSWPGSRPGSQCWNGLHYLVREAPFQSAQLSDCDYSIDFSEIASPDNRVAIITTEPLTSNEEWIEFQKGELILFDDGKPLYREEDREKAEMVGHGLQSNVLPPSTFIGAGI